MDKKLEQQIALRKDESRRQRIEEKAKTIARGLGNDLSESDIESFWYRDSDFHVNWYNRPTGDLLTRTEVILCSPWDKTVYRQENGIIERYIPGEWGKTFDALYQKAIPALRKRELETSAKRTRSEAERNESDELEARECFGL